MVQGRAISAEQWSAFDALRERGFSIREAARRCKVSYTTAQRYVKGEIRTDEAGRARRVDGLLREMDVPPPVPLEELGGVAREALDDFGLFRRRYLGRDTKPWQEEAARLVVELLGTELREWAVVNVPPGSGKSTTFTHDIPVWLICRDRGERLLIGSRTQRQATMYGRRLRSTLMRRRPVEGAEACLIDEFGSFQPADRNLWRSEEFIVWEQEGEEPTDEKEPTVMCAGMDTGFLGGRFRFVIWDDLVDASTIRTLEARQKQQEWFDDEAETRLEPGGLFLLQGQRLSPDDLYAYALSKPSVDEAGEPIEANKYRHIIFPAHDDARCEGLHARTAPAWPEGCLLDPQRLSWRDLMTVKSANPRRFRIIMQQEDVDPAGTLIPSIFIEGGSDESGTYPGCLDVDRCLRELPEGLDVARAVSAISVDPSPTRFWSVQWWAHVPGDELGRRYLLDSHHQVMDAPEFLDRLRGGQYVGLLTDMVTAAADVGLPVAHLIVEQNAAQRFMLQSDYFREFAARSGFTILPHSTTAVNKSNEQFGVQALRPHYQFGRVRLPYGDGRARNVVDQHIKELTTWPQGRTDDTVMAQWFFEWNLPSLRPARPSVPTRSGIPSWLTKKATG